MDVDLQSLERYNRLARAGAERAARSLSDLLAVETVVDITRVSLVSPESARRTLIESVGGPGIPRASDESGGQTGEATPGEWQFDHDFPADGGTSADERRDGIDGIPDSEPACVGITVEGGLSGRALLGLNESSRKTLVGEFLPSVVGSHDPAHAEGGVVEVGNIVLRGFVDGWADHLGVSVDTTPPRQVDPRTIDTEPKSSGIEEFVFLFESELRAVEADVQFDICMLPDYPTLNRLVGGATGLSGPTLSLRRLRQFRDVVERGTDRASDDIAVMTGFETDVTVDRFSFVPITETPNHVPPGSRVGTVFHFDGPPSGYAVLLLSEQSAERVADGLLSGGMAGTDEHPDESVAVGANSGDAGDVGTGLTPLGRSAVGEFGNVVTSGFVDGWADVFGTEIDLSPPEVVEDGGRAILSPVAARLARTQSFAFVLDTGIETGSAHWRVDTDDDDSTDGIDLRLSIIPEETKLSHGSRDSSRRVRNADVNQRRGRRESGDGRWSGYAPRRGSVRDTDVRGDWSDLDRDAGVAGEKSDAGDVSDGRSTADTGNRVGIDEVSEVDETDEAGEADEVSEVDEAGGASETDETGETDETDGGPGDSQIRRSRQDGDSAGGRKQIGLGQRAVATDGQTLATSGLGSCLAVCLFDSSGTAGLARVMLPRSRNREDTDDGTFVDTGIGSLVRELESTGITRRELDAKLVGGSRMLEFSDGRGGIGARNVRVARQVLAGFGISVVATHVGGDYGRSVAFDGESGDVLVRTADGLEERL